MKRSTWLRPVEIARGRVARARHRAIDKAFLAHATGVIHVGANVGQERSLYARYDLPVVWVEPIPEVFAVLRDNIERFPRQIALEGLVTDRDDAVYRFHVASNDGASSSILDIARAHGEMWPEITFERSISLTSATLPTLLNAHGLDATAYDALVLDTQGSELLVLEGAKPMLPSLRYVKTEVADFEAYEGCCQLSDIASFMDSHGFSELSRSAFMTHSDTGTYYDVVYARSDDD